MQNLQKLPEQNPPESEQQTELAGTPQASRPDTASNPVPNAPNRNHKQLLKLTLLVVAIGAVAAILLLFTNRNQPQLSSSTKKDIPLLKVEYTVSEVPQYPLHDNGYGSDSNLILQLFEGLVQYKDQIQIAPALATDWYNPDQSTWVFNLRKGVLFHSGREMTSADVKYTLDYAVAHQNDDRTSNLASANTIKEVDATGPYQVTIKTTAPDPLLLARLTFLDIVDSKAKLGDYNAGTGPYIVKPGTTPTADKIQLSAFDKYWAGHVYTHEVDIQFVADKDQVLSNIKQNKFDLAGPFDKTQQALYGVGYQTIKVSQPGMNFLMLNVNRADSPLHNLAARQAMAYAFDIPSLIKQDGLEGEQVSQLVPIALPGYNPSIKNTPYQPDKAKQLLSTVANSSQQLIYAYNTKDEIAATNRIKQLTAVGFNIKPVGVSDSGSFASNVFAGKYDIAQLGYSSNYLDGSDILSTLLIGNGNYDYPEIDSLMDQMNNTFDRTARTTQMQKIATIVEAQKPIIPIYTQKSDYVLTNKNIVASPDLPGLDNSLYFWKVYEK